MRVISAAGIHEARGASLYDALMPGRAFRDTLSRQRWLLVLVAVVLSAATALVLSLLDADEYRASAQVVVDTAATSLDTELEVANGTEVRAATAAVVGGGADLDATVADGLLRFSATSTKASNTVTAANAYADAYVDERSSVGAEVVDRAQHPGDPLGTSTLVVTLLAAAAGLLIGVVATFVVASLDRTIRTSRQLRHVSGVPNLAVIPRQPIGAERPADVALVRDPNSIESEGYRTLRTSLEFALSDHPRASGHIVLVTSPRPGEGKSSVAANLAAAAAMAGRSVVLVDGDLRRPQLHRLFGVGSDVGLSSVLRGSAMLKAAVHRLTAVHELVLLSGGPPPPDPAELLAHDRLGRLLAALAKSAELVVIDAPPVLPVTDPTLLAQHADAVLMVATAGLSDRAEWSEALERLAVVDANVIGTALLNPDQRVHAVASYRYAPTAPPDNWWVKGTDGGQRRAATEPERPEPESELTRPEPAPNEPAPIAAENDAAAAWLRLQVGTEPIGAQARPIAAEVTEGATTELSAADAPDLETPDVPTLDLHSSDPEVPESETPDIDGDPSSDGAADAPDDGEVTPPSTSDA